MSIDDKAMVINLFYKNNSSKRKDLVIYFAIFIFAFTLRVIFLQEIKDAPVFSLLMGDTESYDTWAREISGGNWLGDRIFYQTPFYPYFLAVLYTISGRNFFVVRLVQILIGATSCLLIARAGRYFFSKKVGVLAGVLLALYPTAIYFDCLIKKAFLGLFFMTLLFFIMGKILYKPKAWLWVVCGMALGCFALTRENALILFFVILLWLFIHFRRESGKILFLWCSLFLFGASLVLFPIALRNKIVGGEFIITTSQFGSNLYIGNNELSDGRYVPMQRGRGDWHYESRDAEALAEKALGRELSPSEVSHYWIQKTLSYIKSDPMDWFGLMARKCLLVWNAIEIGDSEDQYIYNDWSLLFRGLGQVYHFGILCPLMVLGICLTWREWNRIWLIHLILISFVASVVLFYVFSRYRLPMTAAMILFAAAGIMNGRTILKQEGLKKIFIYSCITILAAIIVNWRIIPREINTSATYYNIGLAFTKQGNTQQAIEYFSKSLQINPNNTKAHNGMGNVLITQGNLEEGIGHFLKALQLFSADAAIHHNLANALVQKGEIDKAIFHYYEALQINPDSANTHYMLAESMFLKGKLDEAITHYFEVLRINPDSAGAHFNLGNAFRKKGNIDEAVAHFKEVIRIKPDSPRAKELMEKLMD